MMMVQMKFSLPAAIITIVILILLLGNIILGIYLINTREKLRVAQQQLEQQRINSQAVVFLRLFINTVLKAESEVAFQKRLQLEDAVRDLNDPEILARWEAFTNSKSELEAQTGTKNLLGILAEKIQVQ